MSPTTFAMAIVRDPTNAEIARFLSTRSGAQMVQLVQSLREPAAQAALTAALLLLPPPAPSGGRSKLLDKNKKALNAFVGFRCKSNPRL
jgi:sarcosine oxidase gamma subunit